MSRVVAIGRRAAPAVVVASLALAVPGSAIAQSTFGADLSQEPDVTFGCEEQPFTFPEATNAKSCTWTTVATNESQPSQALQPPEGNGTITQVSVRVGPHTGPMKVVIMRVLLEFVDIDTESVHAEISCCVDAAESETFTPKADAVTTVPVSLPVEVQGGVTPGLKVDDVVGLSVLEAGVPIPAVSEQNLGILEQATDYDEFPAMTLGGTQLAGDPRGYQLLMDAVWDQAPSGGGGGGGGGATTGGGNGGGKVGPAPTPTPTATPVVPTLTFRPGGALAQIKGNDAIVQLGCGAGAACDGTVRLQSAPAGHVSSRAQAAGHHKGTGKKHTPVVTYASAGFKIAAGASASVKAVLSSSAKKLARRHRRLKVWVNVTLDGATPPVTSHAITLKF